jgi:colanic acid/amylovoran biosynthesis protein
MRILIVNLHSSHNAGDDVLTRVTVQQLAQAFPGARLTLAMNDPGSYQGAEQTIGSFMTWLKDERGRWRLRSPVLLLLSFLTVLGYRLMGERVLALTPAAYRPLLKAYFSADLVVSSAGNFLYSSGRFGLVLLLALYIMVYGWLAGKPLYTMPQTIGPLRHRWEEWLARWTLGKARLLFVRDAISQAELQRIGAWDERCRLVPDVAFALPPAPTAAGESLLAAHGLRPEDRPRLGVTLINWGAQNRLFAGQEGYETAVAHTIRHFLQRRGGQVFLFAQVRGPSPAEDDLIPAQRVKAQLADLGDQVVLVAAPSAPEELKAAYGLMDLFLGSRLHSNIFALCEGVPAVTIQYQYKTHGVMQMLGLEEWVIEIEQVNEADLSALLARLWGEQANARRHLQNAMPTIVAEASGVGQAIAADYRAGTGLPPVSVGAT